MRKGLIIFVIAVLAAGSLAGVVFYRKNTQKDKQLSDQLKQIEALKKKIPELESVADNFKKQALEDRKRIKSTEDEKRHWVQLENLLKEKDEALTDIQKEYDALKGEIEKNETLRKALKEQIALIQDQQKQDRSRLEELEKRLQDTRRLLSEAENEKERIKSTGNDFALKLEKERTEKQTLQRELAQAHDNITRDQIESQNREKELETAQSQIANLQQEIQKNEKVKATLEGRVSDYETQIIGLKEAYRRIQTLQQEIHKTADINSSLKHQISILQIQLNDYQAKTRNDEDTIGEKEILLKQIVTNLNKCMANSRDVETRLKSAQSQVIDLTGIVEQAKAEQTVMSGRLSSLETEKAELEEKVSGLTNQIRTLKKDRFEDQLAFQNKQKELEAAQSEIVNLKQEIQKNERVKAVLEEKVSGLKTQALDLKDAHNRMVDLQQEIQQTTKLNLSLKNLVSILQIQLNNYKEKTLNFESTIEEKETQLKQIVTNLNNCLVSSKDVESSLQSAQSQIMGLTELFEQARARQVVLSKQLSNLEAEKAEMAMKLNEVEQTYDALIRELHDKIETKEAVIKDCEKKFSVTFVDRVLFHSGKASIVAEGRDILKKTGDILSKMRFGIIRIAGHTDNVAIRRGWRGMYPSNWELSTARAAAVARFFQKESHIPPETMEVVGFGEHQPIASNMTREGRAKNRRVEITISPMGPMVRTSP